MHASIFTERTAQKCTQCACNACNYSNSLWTARACYTEVDSVLCHGYAKMDGGGFLLLRPKGRHVSRRHADTQYLSRKSTA